MNDQRTLRFDVFTVLDGYPAAGQRPRDTITRTLSEAELADQLGFDTFWLAEHHFAPYGICPSPPVLLSAIAQHTRHIRLGPAVCVLPLEHPIRVAEQYAMVDIISGGRLEMAVGAGYLNHEFAGFGVDTNRVTIIGRNGHQEDLQLMSKTDLAEELLDRIEEELRGR